jgi:hypothetical protein
MTATYAEFLAAKRLTAPTSGIGCTPDDVADRLHGFQRYTTAWAVRRGRAAVWLDTGLGKTRVQVEWLRQILRRGGGGAGLILAPLAVAEQTIREAALIGALVEYIPDTGPAVARRLLRTPGLIAITNYDRLHKVDPRLFRAIALDESSILKDVTSKTRDALIAAFAHTPYRLACTATPAPNDVAELANHAEFLGVASRRGMLATYFTHDDDGWRLKGHAASAFWRWVATWAIAARRPSDLGYPDDGYDLPRLRIVPQLLPVDVVPDGQLFATDLGGIGGRATVRRTTLEARCARAVDLVRAEPAEPWLLWCGLNDEADRLTAAIPGAVNVHGSLPAEEKTRALLGFADGTVRTLVTKVSVAGLGMNWQHCARMAFVGLSDCYDQDTEVLTRQGWKTFGKVVLDDDLATVNQQTLLFEWQAPSRTVWEPYSGLMLHFQGQRNFDLLVTPNHRLLVQRCPDRYRSDGTWELRYAGDIAKRFRRQEYRMLSAPTSAAGERPEHVEIPSYGRLNSRSRTIERVAVEDFMRLAGWYLSEGYCRPIDSHERGRIVVCQTDKNPGHRAEIIDLMSRIGLHVNAHTKDITGYSVNLAAYLLDQFGTGSYGKRIPRWVKDLHPELLAILRDTMLKGDGCHADGIPRFYRTASTALADDFQEISLRTGIRAAIHYRPAGSSRYSDHGVYDVCLAWERTRPAVHQAPEFVLYEGMIGCATVPNHTLVVRRNGIPVVSGNSYEAYYQAIRRCWRYGQTRPVEVHVVLSELEAAIAANVARKERDVEQSHAALIGQMRAMHLQEAV